jgi:hypothetical protein
VPTPQIEYNDKAITAGAQSERRGDAGLVRGLLGGKDLTGRFSITDFRIQVFGNESQI